MTLLDGTRLHLYASLVGLACYLNAPACDFVFDDAFAVVSNADVQPGTPLLPLWSHDFWGKACVLFHHLALSLSPAHSPRGASGQAAPRRLAQVVPPADV